MLTDTFQATADDRLTVALPGEPAVPEASPAAGAAGAGSRSPIWRFALFAILFLWLLFTAPLSKSLEPIAAPGLTLLSAEGEPIARRGAITDQPVEVGGLARLTSRPRSSRSRTAASTTMPVSIRGGLRRAAVKNAAAGGVVEGGSTITQQLAKLAFLSSDRTAARKLQRGDARLLARGLARQGRDPVALPLVRLFRRQCLRPARRRAALFQQGPGGSDGRPGGDAGRPDEGARPASPRPAISRRARERGRVVLDAMVETGALTEAEAEAVPTGQAEGPPRRGHPDRHLFRRLGLPRSAGRGRKRLWRAERQDDARRRSAALRGARDSAREARRRAGRSGGDAARRPGRRDDRRQELQGKPVQPRHPGQAAAGIDLQAVRLSRRAALRHDARIRRCWTSR